MATPTKVVLEALGHAAELAAQQGLTQEDFMTAAFTAFLDARPGLREELADHALGERLATLRARGLIATA